MRWILILFWTIRIHHSFIDKNIVFSVDVKLLFKFGMINFEILFIYTNSFLHFIKLLILIWLFDFCYTSCIYYGRFFIFIKIACLFKIRYELCSNSLRLIVLIWISFSFLLFIFFNFRFFFFIDSLWQSVRNIVFIHKIIILSRLFNKDFVILIILLSIIKPFY